MDLIVFTDLDATLLDEHSYAWQAARPALRALAERRVPVVLASSKTRAELLPLARELGVAGPLIVENGGGVLLGVGWEDLAPGSGRDTPDGRLVTLGVEIDALRQALPRIAEECGVAVRGFGSMAPGEIAALTGLAGEAVARAAAREFDEPFLVAAGPPDAVERLDPAARRLDLRVTSGGRFLHLTGPTDKGEAVLALLRWRTKKKGESMISVALGDSPNDLSMLQAVDRPIIVPRPEGRPHAALAEALPGAMVAPAPGPVGWNAAILGLLASFDRQP